MATQRDVAEHLGITQPAVATLVKEGVIVAAGRGRYDLDLARLAYCARLREQAAGRMGRNSGLDLATERARLASAQAEAIERKNAVERGELGVRHDMIAGGHTVIAAAVARLQQVGALVSLGDRKLRKRIETAIDDVLSDLSMVRIMREVEGDFTDQGEDDD